jgi:predicted RNA-binding protein with PIN domain
MKKLIEALTIFAKYQDLAIRAVFDRRQVVPSEAKTTWERLDQDDDT